MALPALLIAERDELLRERGLVQQELHDRESQPKLPRRKCD
jgi:hypothetical protein